jgi:hypothetical protein
MAQILHLRSISVAVLPLPRKRIQPNPENIPAEFVVKCSGGSHHVGRHILDRVWSERYPNFNFSPHSQLLS